jgi:hypothetical protein
LRRGRSSAEVQDTLGESSTVVLVSDNGSDERELGNNFPFRDVCICNTPSDVDDASDFAFQRAITFAPRGRSRYAIKTSSRRAQPIVPQLSRKFIANC